MTKKLTSILLTLLSSYCSYAQWTGQSSSSDLANTISRTGLIALDGTGGAHIRLNSSGTYYGKIGNPSAQVWSLGWGGSGTDINQVLNWTATGNVGIGIATPSEKFEVAGKVKIGSGSEYGLIYHIVDFNQTGYPNVWPDRNERALMFKANGDYDGFGAGGGGFQFWTHDINGGTYGSYTFGQKQAMVIRRNGNIGIGTATPYSKLSIRTTSSTQGLILSNVDVAGNVSPFGFTTADQSSIGLGGTESYFNIYNDGKWVFNSGNTNGTTLPISFDTNCIPRVFIEPSGNVGIGTSTPIFKLDVAGPIASSYTYLNNVIDVENSYTRSNFGSNVYWDPIANYWQVRAIGNNDFASIIHTNGGGFAFITAPTTGNVPRSLTHGEFMANERLRITSSGDIGIGTANPDAKLTVKGTIHTNEVRVDLLGAVAPDYVFEKDYTLLSLSELATYINKNKHLPELPSAQEMEENGVNLKEMNLILLKKIEELTLHLIEMKKGNDAVLAQMNMMQNEINQLKK